jgi:hypothetical protein
LLTLEGYRECKPCRVECRDRGWSEICYRRKGAVW